VKGTSFVALYRGATVSSARLIAVSADPELAAQVSARLLDLPGDGERDPVVVTLEQGRRAALRAIKREVGDVPAD
jgi:hypothetical protein